MATRRKREWFDDDAFWRDLYPFMFPDRRFADTPVEIQKVLSLTTPTGKAALDLCCGPGRCAIALAQQGFAVTGVDRTGYLLDKARAKARTAKVKVEWVKMDVRGVKNILARTSRVVDPNNADWITNGAGLHFNPNYGFGLIDADAATQMAATYTQPPIEAAYTTGTVQVNAAILDNVPEGVVRSFTLAGNGSLESVEVAVDITHNYPGDLFIQLTSPSGTHSILTYDHTFLDHEMTGLAWTFSSAAFWGENLTGTWNLQVADRWEIEGGMWNSYSVTAYAGVPEPATLALLAIGVALLARRRCR